MTTGSRNLPCLALTLFTLGSLSADLIAQPGIQPLPRIVVAGFFCRVDFRLSDSASGKQREFLRVEEGAYENGNFKAVRIWNGDQTDWGLDFTSAPQPLRVSLGTF